MTSSIFPGQEGFETLKNDLHNLSKGQGVTFGYAGLIKIFVVCLIAGMALMLGVSMMEKFLGLF